uniref:Uncharacterized protein n=1 Tax=uncultured marine virus TaxID=186617 RepID=A0A0F7LC16_9VIRU|nr:hypothetical protein [uncultured marine virus]
MAERSHMYIQHSRETTTSNKLAELYKYTQCSKGRNKWSCHPQRCCKDSVVS